VTFVTAATLLAAVLVISALRFTNGTFGYSLDDAYIHLALAERILGGHYGLNPNEAASPASSIVFPFLLAALLKFGLGQAAPLIINLFSTVASMVFLASLAAEAGIDLNRVPTLRLLLASVTLLLGFNLIGLAFTGLEHSLHVADTLACLLGIVRTVRTGRMPRWLPFALVLNPLIRFEGLSVWGAGVVVLALQQKRLSALVIFLSALFLVGGYCLWLHSLGLPSLPSSVLVKSHFAGSASPAGAFSGLLPTLLGNVGMYGVPQILFALALLLVSVHDSFGRVIALFAGLPILAHLLGGAFGWFGRYEIYVLVLAWSGVLVLQGRPIMSWLVGSWPGLIVGLMLLLAINGGYAKTTLLTPRAISEIHLQQYQMHRFVVEFWRRPVAVNDLGWVSYDNPNYVLDLYGLGSEAARTLRIKSGPDPSWMEKLVRQHNVSVAMIYTSWFPVVPTDWIPVATLTLQRSPVAVAGQTVTFYATTPLAIPALRDTLAKFAHTLQSGVELVIKRDVHQATSG
jgi:hypothetical protein